MVKRTSRPGRNRNGGYDLSTARKARHSRGLSKQDTGNMPAHAQVARNEASSFDHEVGNTGSHSLRRHETHVDNEKAAAKQAMKEAAALAEQHLAAREQEASPREKEAAKLAKAANVSVGAKETGAGKLSKASSDSAHERYADPVDGAQSYSTRKYKARKTGMSTGKKVGISIIVVLLVALIGAGTAAALWYSGIAANLRGDKDISATTGAEDGKPYYVLLLGGDSRQVSEEADANYGNRTDSMMVARVDEQNKKVTILSIPRDTRIAVEGHGYQKINSVIEFSGYDGVINEINEMLGIKINYYAFIYFSGFKDLVDKLGGVTVKVPEGTYYHGVEVPAGDAVEIDGKEALVLARCRHGYPADQGAYAMGDYQRMVNQRNLIKAIAKKVLKQDATQLPDLISNLSSCVETNMDPTKLISLAQNMKGMDVDSITSASLPFAGANIDGAYYDIMYQDVYEEVIKNFADGKDPYDGLAKFDTECNGNDIGSDYVDGPLYAYTKYEKHYGEFKGTSDN